MEHRSGNASLDCRLDWCSWSVALETHSMTIPAGSISGTSAIQIADPFFFLSAPFKLIAVRNASMEVLTVLAGVMLVS